MNTKLSVILVGASVALVGLAGAAFATGGGGIGQSAKYISASNDDLVQNDVYVDIGGDNGDDDSGNAVANCQWLLSVNAFFNNAVAIESLGLVDEGLDILFPVNSNGDSDDNKVDQSIKSTNGTSSCTQEIGAIRVTLDTSPGFGEAPPLDASALGALASRMGGGGGYIGGGKLYQGVGGVYSGNDDMVQNDADVDIYGSGNAVANCQLLIAWNTAGTNMASVKQDATFKDGIDIGFPEPVRTLESGNDKPKDKSEIEHEFANGTATCKQTVASIDLHIGDDVFIPPQS